MTFKLIERTPEAKAAYLQAGRRREREALMVNPKPRVVDISHHNYDASGPYDFNAAKRWGIWGVIAKATEGTDYVDPTYTMAREGARKAGLLFGTYHFFRPGRVDEQVEHFLSTVWDTDRDREELLLCLDHEDEGCSVEDVKQFMKAVEDRTGQCPVLYSGHLIKDQLGSREDAYLGSARLWLAQYGNNPEVQLSWRTYWLWQFTGDGEGPAPHDVPGIGNDVDISSWEGTADQLEAEWYDSEGVPDVPTPPTPPATEVPAWLSVMRAITGLTENPGSGDNPFILHMSDAIAREYPDMASYCAQYTHDDIAWCGLTAAYCMTLAGIRPVFGDTDTERWMWADAWSTWPDGDKLSEPTLGCVVVFLWDSGSHHVTLFEREEGDSYICRGGNQSDMVNTAAFPKRNAKALLWPKGRHRPHLPPPDIANQTMWLQSSLNIVMPTEEKLDVDGEIGPATEGAVKKYQRDEGLPATGDPDKVTVKALLTDLLEWNKLRRT